jgi:hypothetical protein
MENLDIFSSPFRFNVRKGKSTKQTFIGGILSFFILGASLVYLVYVMYLFFNRSNPPSVSKTTIIND